MSYIMKRKYYYQLSILIIAIYYRFVLIIKCYFIWYIYVLFLIDVLSETIDKFFLFDFENLVKKLYNS